jgi:uncharacterized phage protein (predicted DNA packaging)
MDIITLEECKQYLRIDSDDDDGLVETLANTSERLCEDVARMETDEFSELGDMGKTAVLYGVGYLFEHREEANYGELKNTLKLLMSDIRNVVL